MKKIFFILLGLGILFLPNMAGAVSSLAEIVGNVRYALNLAAGGVVLISWIVVAVLFLSTLGSPEKYNTAKKALMWTIVGTALYALGNLVLVMIREAFLGG